MSPFEYFEQKLEAYESCLADSQSRRQESLNGQKADGIGDGVP